MPAVFISYSRRDKAFVQRLHDALVARDYEVWVDWEDIPPSAEWFEEIQAGVRSADGFIYVISPDSVSSAVCTRELDNALAQNKRVVPVIYREPDGATVPEQAAALNWVFLRDADDFDAGLATLLTALETDLEHVRVHTRLGIQANRWESDGRDRSLLLRGSDLSSAEQWLAAGAGKRPEATQLQREYLLASRQSATQRQRTLIGGVSVALVIAVALAVVALIQRANAVHESHVAYARSLDTAAQLNDSIDPELSVLLSVRAADVNPSAQTESALRASLAQSQVRARYPLVARDAAGDVIWSPDGRRLLVTSPGVGGNSWARIYAPGSSAPSVSMPGPSDHGSSGWDAAGNRVVIGGGTPAIYDAVTGHLISRIPGSAIHAALTPDGTRVVTVDIKSIGHVFDLATGRSLGTFTPHYRAGSNCFALSPNGRYVAQCEGSSFTAGPGNTPAEVDIWDAANGQLIRSVHTDQLISSVAFSPDSARFVFTLAETLTNQAHATPQEVIRAEGAPGTFVYDTTGSGPPVKTFPGAASAASFGPYAKEQSVAWTTVADNIGHVYQFFTGREIPLSGATGLLDTVSFDHSGAYVLTAGDDGVIRVYNPSIGGAPVETLAGHKDRVLTASFGDGDDYVASSSEDGTARLWQGPTPIPTLQRTDAPLGDAAVPTVGFTLAGDRIVIGGGGRTLSGQGRILDARTLGTLATFTAPAGQVLAGDQVSRDGRTLAALTGRVVNDRLASVTIESFDAGTGARLATMAPSGGLVLENAGLNRSGSQLAMVESGGRVELWSPRTGRLLHVLAGVTTPAEAFAFSQDGSTLAVAHYPAAAPQPVSVQLWNTASGALERTIAGEDLTPQIPGEQDYAPLAVAFSPNGNLLALSGAQPNVQLFDPRTGATAHAPLSMVGLSAGSYAGTLAFSPNGSLLAAGSGAGAYLWNVPSFQTPSVFQALPPGDAGVLSPGAGVRVGFTQDSRTLTTFATATGLDENTLEAWNIHDQLQLFQVDPLLAAGSMNAAGTELVTATPLGGISVYPCQLCGGLPQLLALAKHRVTRSFTPAERAQYLSQS
jgi:WD40 repeat protein